MAEHVMTSEAATKLLADCFRMAGADCDGNEDWRIAPRALRAVTDLRRDYGEACDEAHNLRTKVAELEQQMQGLRARLAQLVEAAPKGRVAECCGHYPVQDEDYSEVLDDLYDESVIVLRDEDVRALLRGEGE